MRLNLALPLLVSEKQLTLGMIPSKPSVSAAVTAAAAAYASPETAAPAATAASYLKERIVVGLSKASLFIASLAAPAVRKFGPNRSVCLSEPLFWTVILATSSSSSSSSSANIVLSATRYSLTKTTTYGEQQQPVHVTGGNRAHPMNLEMQLIRRRFVHVAAWQGGVVWCGVVWCGVVWCGVVWCGVKLSLIASILGVARADHSLSWPSARALLSISCWYHFILPGCGASQKQTPTGAGEPARERDIPAAHE